MDSHETRVGLVQVFTGDGKGKTTAAIGAVIRALGQGLKVCIVFLMKAGQRSGEYTILARLPNVTIARFGKAEFVDPQNISPEDREPAQLGFLRAREAVLSGRYDLVVLDEVNLATHWKLIDVSELVSLISEKPRNVEIILTGRQADSRITKLADLVTEFREVKHPFKSGITARKGIEY